MLGDLSHGQANLLNIYLKKKTQNKTNEKKITRKKHTRYHYQLIKEKNKHTNGFSGNTSLIHFIINNEGQKSDNLLLFNALSSFRQKPVKYTRS